MGFLNGLRGGQYLGFSTQNVPTVNLMELAPPMQTGKGSGSSSADKIEGASINTYEGTTAHWLNMRNQGEANIASGEALVRDASRRLLDGDATADKDLIEGQKLINSGYKAVTQSDGLKEMLEQYKIDQDKGREPLNPNLPAMNQAGTAPFGFEGDVNASWTDMRNYPETERPYLMSDVDNALDKITWGRPGFDSKTGQPTTDEKYRSPSGARKEIDFTKDLVGYFQDAKGMKNTTTRLLDGQIAKLPGYEFLVNEYGKEKTHNNYQQINTLLGVSYDILSPEAQNQATQSLFKEVLSNITSLPMLTNKSTMFKTEKEAQDYAKLLEGTIYEYTSIDKKDGGYNLTASIIDPALRKNPTAYVNKLHSLVNGNNMDQLTRAYVTSTTNQMAGIYTYDQTEKDMSRGLYKLSADTNINIGNDDKEFNKTNETTAAVLKVAAGLGEPSEITLNLGFGKTATGNRIRSTFGANYTSELTGTDMASDRLFFSNSGSSVYTNINGWKIVGENNAIASMPGFAIRGQDAESFIVNDVTNNINSIFKSSQGDNSFTLLGLSIPDDINRFYNDEKGLLPIKDIRSITGYHPTPDSYVPGTIDNMLNYTTEEKQKLKNLITELNDFEVVVGMDPQLTNAKNFKMLVKDYFLDGSSSEEFKNQVGQILNNAGSVITYKQYKDIYDDPTQDKKNQVFVQNDFYIADTKHFKYDNSIKEWDKYNMPTMYRAVDIEYTMAPSYQGFFQAMDNIQVSVAGKNMSFKNLLDKYNIQYDHTMWGRDLEDAFKDTEGKSSYEILGDVADMIYKKKGVRVDFPFTQGSSDNTILMSGEMQMYPIEAIGTSGGRYYKDIHESTRQILGGLNIDEGFEKFLQEGTIIGTED